MARVVPVFLATGPSPLPHTDRVVFEKLVRICR